VEILLLYTITKGALGEKAVSDVISSHNMFVLLLMKDEGTLHKCLKILRTMKVTFILQPLVA
jgi:hypothetical protein